MTDENPESTEPESTEPESMEPGRQAGKAVSASKVVAAPAEKIFEVLADPSQHSVIDGSGTVRAARPGAPGRLSLGARFGMDMRMGLPYRIKNVVVEFEEGRRIAWRHMGGHVWRYELTPVEGGTEVTETFDWTKAKAGLLYPLMGVPARNQKAMEKTLERLAGMFEGSG